MTALSLEIGQIKVNPGEIEKNSIKLLKGIESATRNKSDIVAFPEMCVPGYLLGDMWERQDFLHECEYWNQKIIQESGETAVLFGTICIDWDQTGEDGRPRKYNSAILAHQGKAVLNPGLNKPYIIKTLLPNYREFDDTRHFSDLRKLSMENESKVEDMIQPFDLNINGNDFKIGVSICEDAWSQNYNLEVLPILGKKGSDIIFNLSCSPFTLKKNDRRNQIFSDYAKEIKKPLVYINNIGIQNNGKTIYTFDGTSTAYDINGKIILEAKPFVDKQYKTEIPLDQPVANPINLPTKESKIEAIYNAVIYGTKNYLNQINCNKVALGISGGIDSAVAAALYGLILKPENLLLVNMPGPFTSSTTKKLAFDLSKKLGCLFTEFPIGESVDLTKNQFEKIEVQNLQTSETISLKLSSFHLENVQARDRSSRILSAISSAFNGVFSCNSNKAEITVGYSTLYGDLCGFLALIGDLWKQEVYSLGRYLNETIYKKEIIPQDIFTIPPSAELSPEHNVDQGKGDPLHYPYHDKLFFSWVQSWNRNTPADILKWYKEGTLTQKLNCPDVDVDILFPTSKQFIQDLEKWWNLYNGMGVAKRVQAPPILAVSSRAFGFDHREHIGVPFYSQEYLNLKKDLLEE